MAQFSIQTFKEALSDECTLVPADGDAITATLAEVTSLHESKTENMNQFSVVWRVPKSAALQQGMVTVTLPEQDSFDLFVVPVGEEPDALLFEAVFA